MNNLTNVSCIYTGGNIYTYQAMYNGYWIFGSLDSTMEAYSYEPFRYWKDTDSSESPEVYRVPDAQFLTWLDIIESLSQPGSKVGGSRDECISIIKEFQTLSQPVNIE